MIKFCSPFASFWCVCCFCCCFYCIIIFIARLQVIVILFQVFVLLYYVFSIFFPFFSLSFLAQCSSSFLLLNARNIKYINHTIQLSSFNLITIWRVIVIDMHVSIHISSCVCSVCMCVCVSTRMFVFVCALCRLIMPTDFIRMLFGV